MWYNVFMDIKTLKTEIAKANLTSVDIDQLWDILKDKNKTLRAQAKIIARATLSIGDKVTIKDIRPKALVGLSGKVVNIRSTRADVQLDKNLDAWHPAAKHVYAGKVSGIPLTCLEII
jgi:hypothetical protein